MTRLSLKESKATRSIAGRFGSAVAAAILLTALPSAARADGAPANFEARCQVLDETGLNEKNAFRGGETAILRLQMDIPEDVYDDQIDVQVFAEIKVKGFKYRVKLPILDVDIPERPERLSIDGYTPDLQTFIPFRQLDTFNDVDFDAQVEIKLPDNVPNTKFTLKAVGTIKGAGKQTCKEKVRLIR